MRIWGPNDRVTADDLVRLGCCLAGVMEHVTPNTPAAMPVSSVVRRALRAREGRPVIKALYGGDGFGDGFGYGYGYGNGFGNGDGNGYGNGDGYGYGNGDGSFHADA